MQINLGRFFVHVVKSKLTPQPHLLLFWHAILTTAICHGSMTRTSTRQGPTKMSNQSHDNSSTQAIGRPWNYQHCCVGQKRSIWFEYSGGSGQGSSGRSGPLLLCRTSWFSELNSTSTYRESFDARCQTTPLRCSIQTNWQVWIQVRMPPESLHDANQTQYRLLVSHAVDWWPRTDMLRGVTLQMRRTKPMSQYYETLSPISILNSES